ncbi:MAG: DarT ssDNA thymidine ADP-ribosyltransferase family protein [Proteobacteria bacterium]|nr:DarT ssDNA thymidine ADP-ribosyltransferase family protein [Pseudomonadota bacterium]
MSAAFGRLSPAMQYQIGNALGFPGLRPVQEQTIDAVLAGDNCVVLAPTAGGKTEAAFFPLLSRMDTEDWKPVSVIYVAPIRALLNNQEERLQRYAGLIGRRAFKWHGDVTASDKRGFVGEPADILLTTPESLEVMLMSKKVPAERLFRGLQAVVIDEIHAFVGDDRGGHLASVMERLSRFCGRDVQRIGLSATVGNPPDILRWVAGSSKRPGRVVDPGGSRKTPEIALDWVGSADNAAKMIQHLHPGKKRLVFVDSRRGVEGLGERLRTLGVDAFVTHSSLSLEERLAAETAFQDGQDCVIVATSVLELGIDIGDLDHVLQLDAPTTVAAFLQRMGRSGRRDGKNPNCTFLGTEEDHLLQAAAIIRLFRRGFVEPIAIAQRSAHLLAHQILAMSVQMEGGVPIADWWAWVSSATPFQKLDAGDRKELVEHMLAAGILAESGGRYALGPRGEKLYGWRNFADLYSVFSTPKHLKVFWGTSEIGSIDVTFAETKPDDLTFILAAKPWRAVHIDFTHGLVRVEPIPSGELARWQGGGRLLSRELCQAIRDVIVTHDVDPEWSRRAQTKLAELRTEYRAQGAGDSAIVADAYGLRWWNFGGGKANNLIARVLEEKLGDKVVVDNLYVAFRGDAAKSEAAIRQAIAELRQEGRPNHADALRLAEGCARGRAWAFSDRHAELAHALHFDDLAQLSEVRWDVMKRKYWTDVQEERQAEFLVREFFAWTAVQAIAVRSPATAERVRQLLLGEAHLPPVTIKPEWYYP